MRTVPEFALLCELEAMTVDNRFSRQLSGHSRPCSFRRQIDRLGFSLMTAAPVAQRRC